MALFVSAGAVLLAGLVTLSSISRELFLIQLGWVVLGAGVIFGMRMVEWRSLISSRWFSWGLYAVSLVLLGIALGGPTIRNVQSWIVLGPFRFQPVELAKPALILALAAYFERRHISIARMKHIAASFVIFVLPAGLTLLQPDMGSAVVLFGIWSGSLLASGLPRRRVFAAIGLLLVLAACGWFWFLKDYQRARIEAVFYPEENVLTVNYSAAQSKIAIGSAGLWGKGYGQGTQTQLGFLTEPATDFIYAAFIEEWGIVPGVLLALVFLLLLLNILHVGLRADHNIERFLCIGAVMVFGGQFLMNAGSVTGIFPVVGVPFPFLSYGGSSMVVNCFLLSLVHAISRRS